MFLKLIFINLGLVQSTLSNKYLDTWNPWRSANGYKAVQHKLMMHLSRQVGTQFITHEHTIMEPPPSWQDILLINLVHGHNWVPQLSAWNNWNHYSSDHATCCQSSRVQLKFLRGQVKHCPEAKKKKTLNYFQNFKNQIWIKKISVSSLTTILNKEKKTTLK